MATLVKHGVPVDAVVHEGVTPLMTAASNNAAVSAQKLVELKADVNRRTAAGWTALLYAAETGSVSVLDALLDAKADMHAVLGAEGKSLLGLSKRIRTFTEGIDASSPDLAAIRQAVGPADELVFLGFAFHAQNMELLLPPRVHPSMRVCGTAFRMSKRDIATTAATLIGSGVAADSIELRNDLMCSALFDEYGRSLSMRQLRPPLALPPRPQASKGRMGLPNPKETKWQTT